jgi:hypothetical protein
MLTITSQESKTQSFEKKRGHPKFKVIRKKEVGMKFLFFSKHSVSIVEMFLLFLRIENLSDENIGTDTQRGVLPGLTRECNLRSKIR